MKPDETICQKCRHRRIGATVVPTARAYPTLMTSVKRIIGFKCNLAGVLFEYLNEPSQDCPYYLEHLMETQSVAEQDSL